MNFNTMFDDVLTKRDVADTTRAMYKSNFNTMSKILDDDFWELSPTSMVKVFEKMDKSAHQKKSMLNLTIIYKQTKLDKNQIEPLIAYRHKLADYINSGKAETNKKIIEELPEFEQYLKDVNAIKKKQGIKYIINTLLIELSCRNLDLDCEIFMQQPKSELKKRKRQAYANEKNFLEVRSKDVVLHRKFYKTVRTYGEKVNIIKNLKLRNAIAQHYKDQDNLIPFSVSNLSRYIESQTFNLGEGKIFKMSVHYYKQKGDLQKIQEMGKSRGTDVQTIIENYDLDG